MEFRSVRTEAEIAALSALAEEIWREYFVRIISRAQIDYMLDLYLSQAALGRAIREEGYDYRIATEDGEAVGFFGVRRDGEELFVSKLYLRASARGGGRASAMLRFLCETYRPSGVRRLRLTCNKHNDASLAIYRHWGFAVADSVVTDIGGGYVMDDYVMTKELP